MHHLHRAAGQAEGHRPHGAGAGPVQDLVELGYDEALLFDLEIAFLFPWAVVLDQIGLAGFLAMMVFLAILVVGFVYEWKKGALEWE